MKPHVIHRGTVGMGTSQGNIAVDPLEGTNIVAKECWCHCRIGCCPKVPCLHAPIYKQDAVGRNAKDEYFGCPHKRESAAGSQGST